MYFHKQEAEYSPWRHSTNPCVAAVAGAGLAGTEGSLSQPCPLHEPTLPKGDRWDPEVPALLGPRPWQSPRVWGMYSNAAPGGEHLVRAPQTHP